MFLLDPVGSPSPVLYGFDAVLSIATDDQRWTMAAA